MSRTEQWLAASDMQEDGQTEPENKMETSHLMCPCIIHGSISGMLSGGEREAEVKGFLM